MIRSVKWCEIKACGALDLQGTATVIQRSNTVVKCRLACTLTEELLVQQMFQLVFGLNHMKDAMDHGLD